ncbi:glutamate--cysteine ligase [Thermithiobacillus plumbiphilus]|uniref:Glutamate--cysteine ligase n=1 Tax=Thermithiobacillus plumbiphilus TaxID=1729899 RepID=A0ABU9D8E6_9PROT
MPSASFQVPHLTTAMVGPLHALEARMLEKQAQIEHWFRCQWQATPPPFYASVDLRNAGFKLAPVDTNLFPAGFNNLNPDFYPLCVSAIQNFINRHNPGLERVLLIPENHTRNLFYLENVLRLKRLLELAGLQVRVGSLSRDVRESTRFDLPSGQHLMQEPLQRQGNRIGTPGFDPELLLLNNDLSAGRPEILEGLEQPIFPPLVGGWSTRRKSMHFAHYRAVAKELASLLELDAWSIDPEFRKCDQIDFMKKSGMDCLVQNVNETLDAIRAKYAEHGITREPFVVVKADAGTYGMGIMMVKDGEELRDLNRKERTKMATVKEGAQVSDVFIQEGVFTFETVDNAVAEPVVYMIDSQVVGGFYRVHTDRSDEENLNAPGMHFTPLAFAQNCNLPDPEGQPDDCPNRFYAYGVIARLALVAAARELAEMQRTLPF